MPYLDIILSIAGVVGLLAGLVGCVLPVLPGPPLAYLGMVALHFTSRIQFSTPELLFWLAAALLTTAVDTVLPIFGNKKFGGGKHGAWGCALGVVAGFFLFPPWGLILCPLVGAFVGEIMSGKKSPAAMRAALGALLGFLLGTVAKAVVCGLIIFRCAQAAW